MNIIVQSFAKFLAVIVTIMQRQQIHQLLLKSVDVVLHTLGFLWLEVGGKFTAKRGRHPRRA